MVTLSASQKINSDGDQCCCPR